MVEIPETDVPGPQVENPEEYRNELGFSEDLRFLSGQFSWIGEDGKRRVFTAGTVLPANTIERGSMAHNWPKRILSKLPPGAEYQCFGLGEFDNPFIIYE